MTLHFFGHAAFLLETGEYNLLFDPFLTGNPLCKMTVNDLPKIDYILLTHAHGDHIGDTVEIAKKHNSIVICSHELAQSYFTHFNYTNVHPIAISGYNTFPFGRLKVTDAMHSSSFQLDGVIMYGGLATGLLVDVKGKKVFHAGDTGLNPNMKLLEKENIDYAILPVGGNYTMNVEDANEAIEYIKPKNVIPCHYNTFPLIQIDVTGLKNPFGNVKVMNPNSSISL